MSERRYEFEPRGSYTRAEAINRVIADIEACSQLGIDFTVETQHYEQFRHGGNVTKAKCVAYVVQTKGAPDSLNQHFSPSKDEITRR